MPLDFPTFKAYPFFLFVFMRWGVSHKAVTGSKSLKKKRRVASASKVATPHTSSGCSGPEVVPHAPAALGCRDLSRWTQRLEGKARQFMGLSSAPCPPLGIRRTALGLGWRAGRLLPMMNLDVHT